MAQSNLASQDDILSFWFDELSPDQWYIASQALDDDIRARFLPSWEAAMGGQFRSWKNTPRGVLAYLVLTDQFPRNMFRGDGRSFASDGLARRAAKRAVSANWDLTIDGPARQFFYLPLMHSENLADQNRSVRLIKTRLDGENTLLHARAHRDIIRRFGRFPYRNDALGRTFSPAEQAFLADEGYAGVVRALQQSSA